MELLVLANSRKTPARCLAGINIDSKFKRPVPNASGEAVPVQNTFVDINGISTPLRPLDVISFKFVSSGLRSHHKEDIVCDMNSITYERTASIEKVRGLLQELSNENVWFMNSSEPKINASFYDKPGVKAASLALLELRDFTVDKNSFVTGKPRIEFEHLGNHWDLPCTDDYFINEQKIQRASYEHGFVCFSIGDYFEGFHYKIAAGIIID